MVVVVNETGTPLPSAAWQNEPQVRVINANRIRVEGARNTGAAVARTTHLLLLDDDDWLLLGSLGA